MPDDSCGVLSEEGSGVSPLLSVRLRNLASRDGFAGKGLVRADLSAGLAGSSSEEVEAESSSSTIRGLDERSLVVKGD